MKFVVATVFLATLVAYLFARPLLDEIPLGPPADVDMPVRDMDMMPPPMMGSPTMDDDEFPPPFSQSDDLPIMNDVLDKVFGDKDWDLIDEDEEDESLPSVQDVVEIVKNNNTDKTGEWNVVSTEVDDEGNQHVVLVSKDNSTVLDMVIRQIEFKISNDTTTISNDITSTTTRTTNGTRVDAKASTETTQVTTSVQENSTTTPIPDQVKKPVTKRDTEASVDTNGSEVMLKKHVSTTGSEDYL